MAPPAIININVEKLLQEVEKHPAIWDRTLPEYKDRYTKSLAWINICKSFNANFETLPFREKNEIGNKLMHKWRNVKESFQKSIKKKNSKAYLYAKNLQFLLDYWQNPGGTTSNTSSTMEGDPAEEYTMKNVKVEPTENSFSDNESSEARRQKTPSPNIFEEDLTFSEPSLAQINKSSDDYDRAFFDSLLPVLRTFDEDLKLDFRIEVLHLLRDMRTKITQNRNNHFERQENYDTTENVSSIKNNSRMESSTFDLYSE